MGFKVEKESENGCVIRAIGGGDDSKEFLFSAQTALKNLWLDITVEFNAKPEAFSTVLPHLLKLQQVIGGHHKTLVLKGIQEKLTPDILTRLTQMGIKVKDDASSILFSKPTMATPPPMNEGAVSMTGRLDPLAPTTPLPDPGEIAVRFKSLQGRLSQALKRQWFLDGERRLYRDRIKTLAQGRDNWQLNQDQVHNLSELEAQLSKEKNERIRLQQELDQWVQERRKEEENFKKVTSELAAEDKKRREVLDKQLAELNKKQEKLRADYKKKSESRREKLTRAGK